MVKYLKTRQNFRVKTIVKQETLKKKIKVKMLQKGTNNKIKILIQNLKTNTKNKNFKHLTNFVYNINHFAQFCMPHRKFWPRFAFLVGNFVLYFEYFGKFRILLNSILLKF